MNIKNNYLYHLSYQLLAMILPLITTPYVSRIFGTEGIGEYIFTYTVANYFLLFAVLGVANYGTRSIARVRDNQEGKNRKFLEIYIAQFLVALLISGLYLVYVFTICNTYKPVAIMQSLYVLSSLFDITWLYYGEEKFRITSIRSIVVKIITVICIFVFIKDMSDLVTYTFIKASSILFGQVILWIPIIRKVAIFAPVCLKNVFSHYKQMLVLFIPIIATNFSLQIDKIMLGKMTSISNVGLFYSSQMITDIPQVVVTSLSTVMLPVLSNLYMKNEYETYKKYFKNSMFIISFLAIAVTFGIAGIAPEFSIVFFGNEFAACGLYIALLAPHVLLAAWNNVIRVQFLIPTMQDSIFVKSVTLGAVINFIINWLLIPLFGVIGAIIGSILAELSVAIYQTIFVRNELEIGKYIKNSVPMFIIAIVMYLVVRVTGNNMGISITTVIVQILIGALIYLICSFTYFYLSKNKIIFEYFKYIIRSLKN
jgi:O-antigen/teichoic acid export membrane protein